MITITKERLLKIQQWREKYGLGSNVVLPAEEAEELARIALASLEAEPVAWMWEIYGGGYMYAKLKPAFLDATPLYTAPPAPASVLDEVTAEDCPAFVKYDITEVDEAWARGFNACLADMLQGAAGNAPDGWVACSERMPEENAEQEVLACFKGGDISTLYYFEGRWDDAYGIVPIRQDVTHWMPLPAAPQQEVKL